MARLREVCEKSGPTGTQVSAVKSQSGALKRLFGTPIERRSIVSHDPRMRPLSRQASRRIIAKRRVTLRKDAGASLPETRRAARRPIKRRTTGAFGVVIVAVAGIANPGR